MLFAAFDPEQAFFSSLYCHQPLNWSLIKLPLV
jgi:hypothetical protein